MNKVIHCYKKFQIWKNKVRRTLLGTLRSEMSLSGMPVCTSELLSYRFRNHDYKGF